MDILGLCEPYSDSEFQNLCKSLINKDKLILGQNNFIDNQELLIFIKVEDYLENVKKCGKS